CKIGPRCRPWTSNPRSTVGRMRSRSRSSTVSVAVKVGRSRVGRCGQGPSRSRLVN
ncbi:hypothetical protein BGZ94_006874, partial [Podila epigama]